MRACLALASSLFFAAGAPAQVVSLADRSADSPDGAPGVRTVVASFPQDMDKLFGGSAGGTRATGAFIETGTAPEADGHAKAVFTADGAAVIVANRDGRNLTIFDITTRALVREVPLSGGPQHLALSSDGVHAVTANFHEATASIVDVNTGAELFVVPVGAFPGRVTITPDGLTAVVSSAGTATCAVIDIATGVVLRTVPGGTVQGIFSVNPETAAYGYRTSGPEMADNVNMVFPDYSNSRVRVVDITTGAVTDLPTAANPTGLAIIPGAGKAVVTHYGAARRITIVDAVAKVIDSTIVSPVDLDGAVAVNPTGSHAAVSILNACRVVNLSTGVFSADIATASVAEIHTTADGLYALCTGYNGSLISYATQSLVKHLNQFVSAPVGAVSPVSDRAALFSDTFGEDMVILNTNGAAGSRLSAGPSGPAPEADRSRTCAVTPDGSRAVVVCQNSQTAVVVDALTREVLATVSVDRRPGRVAITPDGTKAVVTSRDGVNLTVIDLATYTKTDIPISTRADELCISPDSQFAYAVVITGGDGVWRVNLNTLAVQGAKLATGDMGSIGMASQPFSGIALSHDGATLVTCNSFTNTVSIIDTAAWAVVKTLPTGAFPVSAAFSPDDLKLYVVNRDGESVTVINVAGAASAVAGTIALGGAGTDYPYQIVVTPDGSRLYVALNGTLKIAVCDTGTLTQTSMLNLPTGRSINALLMSPAGDRLFVGYSTGAWTFGGGGYTYAEDGTFRTIDTATNTTVENLPIGRLCAFGGLSDGGGRAALANQFGDGVTLLVTGCPSDFDGNGFVNGDDFDLFVAEFEAGGAGADFDGNSFVNGDDFDAFVAAFEAGC